MQITVFSSTAPNQRKFCQPHSLLEVVWANEVLLKIPYTSEYFTDGFYVFLLSTPPVRTKIKAYD